MRRWAAAAVSGVAVSPVPIAQTGSYAITIPLNCSSDSAAMAYRNCSISAFPAFFFSRSPTQTIGVSPASMAVSDDHVRTAQRPDHRAGDFTGKGTLRRPTKILCANLYPGFARSPNRGLQVKEGGADYDVAILRALDKRPKTLEERRGAGGVLVHLPVPTDHRCSHLSSPCKPRRATIRSEFEMHIALHFGALRSMLVNKTFQTLTTGQGESRIRE